MADFSPSAPADLIGGEWRPIPPDGAAFVRSHNPAHPERTVWQGSPRASHVNEAIAAARRSAPAWARASVDQRAGALRRFKALVEEQHRAIADLLCDETGKAMWEAEAEAKLLAVKADTTLLEGAMSDGSGRARVSGFEIPLGATRRGRCSFRPHGVMAVLGPFNFPVHLPNGHILPALLAGNTVVFKPSDKTPAVGALLAWLYQQALASVGAPPGVINLVQGGADIARALVAHDDLDGILFTGSWPVGRAILQANLDRPGRIVALELGGNNPCVVMPDADPRLAAIETVRAAFATTAQRCTCTRRLIVHESIADRFIGAVAKAASALLVGDPRGVTPDRQPFMGPIIRAEARDAVLKFQRDLVSGGGAVVLESAAMDHPSGGHYITPGIVRVPRYSLADDPARDCGCDVEVFGPILRVTTCRSLDDAMDQANATRYGLAASIFTRDESAADRFLAEARAGCVNVNTGTAGASGKLPFGGIGLSGNHRPAGSFALDYCAFPVASMIERGSDAPLSPGMRFDEGWL
ncbi:MAG TPA: N-succinylglutamate 5-semialdehyde dehydrogenase [Phycisphaerales bacterium]|nr:N-succinylglutamate 5-semialdehyde dehydrogenase [Phycisphaerales bacterium]